MMLRRIRKSALARKQDAWFFAAILLLTSAAFIADWRLPLGVAGGVPFVIPLALTLRFPKLVYTWIAAGISTFLIILDVFLKPPSGVPFYFVLVNRGYALLVVGIVVGLAQLKQRLVRQNERLAALSVMEERERLSRELHDDLSQLLGDVGARASAVAELLSQGRTDDAQREMAPLRNSIQRAYLDVRQYITGLRVRPWGDRRFSRTLGDFTRHFAEQAGLKLSFDEAEDIVTFKLAPNVEIQAIRIIQEALTNTLRHANTEHVRVKVRLNDTFLLVTVQDDGQGFDTATIDPHSHLGLQMMQERAELVGGKLAVTSTIGRGTTVTIMLPCQIGRDGAN
ncbi:MAG: sensor histidine kinase [Chloroflexi bacterium]|nr:sensor histidine kinase [Chloroflexota bacterium]